MGNFTERQKQQLKELGLDHIKNAVELSELLPELKEKGMILHTSQDKLRDCGDCHICCIFPGINVLNKPPRQTCHNLDCNGRCSIYEKRPEPCEVFQCSWRLGNFSENYRPNKTGILVTWLLKDDNLAATVMVDQKTVNEDALQDIVSELVKAKINFVVVDEVNKLLLYKDGQIHRGFVRQIDHEAVKLYVVEENDIPYRES
jgi:Fe-S-cluster containining protein